MLQSNTVVSAREAVDVVYRAKIYAVRAHGNQTYGPDLPYAVHLQAVESVLIRFGFYDDDLRAAAWLHDVLEDTNVAYENMAELFGRVITDIVSNVTEPKGGDRTWRHAQTYPRIAKDYKSVVVKLADRIANVEAGGKVDMYRNEHANFKSAITVNMDKFDLEDITGLNIMFDYLDELLGFEPK